MLLAFDKHNKLMAEAQDAKGLSLLLYMNTVHILQRRLVVRIAIK